MKIYPTIEAAVSAIHERLFGEPATVAAPTCETETDPDTLRRQRDNWQNAAARHLRNEQYYRGLLVQCGETIGRDDGTTQQDVMVAKVPELVRDLVAICNGLDKAITKPAAPVTPQPQGCVSGIRAVEMARFTIAEIADYLAGWQAADDSFAHHNALVQLEDAQDGIAAVRERKQDS